VCVCVCVCVCGGMYELNQSIMQIVLLMVWPKHNLSAQIQYNLVK
jgi:hypothetical protein